MFTLHILQCSNDTFFLQEIQRYLTNLFIMNVLKAFQELLRNSLLALINTQV